MLIHSLHSELRMKQRFITVDELTSCLWDGRVTERKPHEKTRHPLWVIEHKIDGCTLRVIVDREDNTILSVYYRTPSGARPENAHRVVVK